MSHYPVSFIIFEESLLPSFPLKTSKYIQILFILCFIVYPLQTKLQYSGWGAAIKQCIMERGGAESGGGGG